MLFSMTIAAEDLQVRFLEDQLGVGAAFLDVVDLGIGGPAFAFGADPVAFVVAFVVEVAITERKIFAGLFTDFPNQ